MVEITRINIITPGQCPVMYCVSSPHIGSVHVDATGQAFNACQHGTLSHDPLCEECGRETWERLLTAIASPAAPHAWQL
jgi:hypothetical protein